MAKKDKIVKDETIIVSKASLETLLHEVEDLRGLKGQVERLESAADLGRLERFDSKDRKLGPRRYLLTVYEGKLITGWLTVADKKWMDGNVMRVQQDYEILFGDGTKMAVKGYDNFATVRQSFRVSAEKVSEKKDEYGTTLTLKIAGFSDEKNPPQGPEADAAKHLFGSEVVIDEKFVN